MSVVWGVAKILTYSKRWYLVHLLGGKCVDCPEENFYELELDHTYDDGDGERAYYTRMIQHYLDNPGLAKKRLAVRCKECHEKRHSFVPVETKMTQMKKFWILLEPIKQLQTVHPDGIPKKLVIDTMMYGYFRYSEEQADNHLSLLLRHASIYESKEGRYLVV